MYLPGLVFHSKPAAPLTVVNGITLALTSNRFSPLLKPAKEHLAMPQTYLQGMHGVLSVLVQHLGACVPNAEHAWVLADMKAAAGLQFDDNHPMCMLSQALTTHGPQQV